MEVQPSGSKMAEERVRFKSEQGREGHPRLEVCTTQRTHPSHNPSAVEGVEDGILN